MKKALEEANARIAIMKAKLRVPFVEKVATDQGWHKRRLVGLMLSLPWPKRKNER